MNYSEKDLLIYIDLMKRTAPRINEMKLFFSGTASGTRDKPINSYEGDEALLLKMSQCTLLHSFFKEYKKRQSFFEKHFASSIPYAMENECRMGTALIKYFSKKNTLTHSSLHLGSSEAPMARTISALGLNSNIKTLATSCTKENINGFYMYEKHPKNTYFLPTPWILVNKNLLKEKGLDDFSQGVDVIFEHQLFQFFSKDRGKQVAIASKLFKDISKGLLFMTGKIMLKDFEEFKKRELQKDTEFKTKYFSEDDIKSKDKEVIHIFNKMLMTLDETIHEIKKTLKYSVVIWNSGNFYTILSSNSKDEINKYLDVLVDPIIEDKYSYYPCESKYRTFL